MLTKRNLAIHFSPFAFAFNLKRISANDRFLKGHTGRPTSSYHFFHVASRRAIWRTPTDTLPGDPRPQDPCRQRDHSRTRWSGHLGPRDCGRRPWQRQVRLPPSPLINVDHPGMRFRRQGHPSSPREVRPTDPRRVPRRNLRNGSGH